MSQLDPGISLMNPGGSLNFDIQAVTSQNREEEEEAAEDARIKEKELQDLLTNAFDDLIEDEDENGSKCSYTHDDVAEQSYNIQNDRALPVWPHVTGDSSTPYSQKTADQQARGMAGNRNALAVDFDIVENSPIDDFQKKGNDIPHNFFRPKLLPEVHFNNQVLSPIRPHDEVRGESPAYPLSRLATQGFESSRPRFYEDEVVRPASRGTGGDEVFQNAFSYSSAMSADRQIVRNATYEEPAKMDEPNKLPYVEQNGYNDEETPTQTSPHRWKEASAMAGHERAQQLELLYKSRGRELDRVTKEFEQTKEEMCREIRILKHQLALATGDQEGKTFSLQQAQQLLSDKENDIFVLRGQMAALETHVAAEREAKLEVMQKLQTAESTIKALQHEIAELGRSESLARAQELHESMTESLKRRHQEETLHLHHRVDNLQHELEQKKDEVSTLQIQLETLEKKMEEMQIQKAETVNRLSKSLEESQKQCQKLLESETLQTVAVLRAELKKTNTEKMEADKQLSSLKVEITNLRSEIETYEGVSSLGQLNTVSAGSGDGLSQLGLRNRVGPGGDAVAGLKLELEKALLNLRERRSRTTQLQDELAVSQKELTTFREKFSAAEARANTYEGRVQELQQKLLEACPDGSIPLTRHNKALQELESQKLTLEKDLQDALASLEKTSENEKMLEDRNMKLKQEMGQMLNHHDEDKRTALERCTQTYLRLHEDAQQQLRQELVVAAEEAKISVIKDYEEALCNARDELHRLGKELQDLKEVYVKVLNEKRELHTRLTELENQERQVYDSVIREELDHVLSEVRVNWEKEAQQRLQAKLIAELVGAQEVWAKQHAEDIIKAVEKAKDEAKTALEKKWTEEKATLQKEYEVSLTNLEQKHGKEKEALRQLHQELQTKQTELERLQKRVSEEDMSRTKSALDEQVNAIMRKFQNAHDLEKAKLVKHHKDEICRLAKRNKELEDRLSSYALAERQKRDESQQTSPSKQVVDDRQQEMKTLTPDEARKLVELDEERSRYKLKKCLQKMRMLERKHLEEVTLLKTEFASAVEGIRKSLIEEVAGRLTVADARAEEVRKEHLLSVEHLKCRHEEEKKKLLSATDAKLNALRTECKATLDSLKLEHEEEKKKLHEEANARAEEAGMERLAVLEALKMEYEELKRKLCDTQPKRLVENVQSQTSGKFLTEEDLLQWRLLYLQSLLRIRGKIGRYVLEANVHLEEKLRRTLVLFQSQLIQKMDRVENRYGRNGVVYSLAEKDISC